jgi:type VI secretion system protein VasD
MMRSSFSLTVLAMLAVLNLLCGCGKPRIDLAVASQANVNPDHTGRPSPVIVKIYEMRSDLAFSQSDFYPLFESPVQVLGAELLAADEMVLLPGEARRITYDPVKETRFLGVLAGFRQMERAKWKIVTPVDSEKPNTVGIELRDVTVELIPRGEVSGWDPAVAVKNFNNPSGEPTSASEESEVEAPRLRRKKNLQSTDIRHSRLGQRDKGR